MRDYRPLDTIRIPFSTNAADGSAVAPTALAGKLYEDGSLTEITAGITMTTSYDGITGLNMAVIDGATAGLKPGSTYHLRVDATVAGLSCVAWAGQFSVMAQGGDIVSRGVLDAGGAGTFTLPAGQRDRVKVGDAIRIVGGTGYGYRPILTYNSATGAGTVSAWDVNPVAGDYYEVVSLPNPEVLAATDFADGFLTGPKINDNAISEAKFATDALSARVLKADAAAEVQAGLATAAGQTAMQTDVTAIKGAVDTEVASILADTTNIKTRLPAALVGGKMDAAVDTSALATAANLATVAGNVSAILADVDTEVAAILAIAQKVDGALELNGGLYRFTVAALANAPTAGGTAPTATEVRDAIFAQLIESGLTFEQMCKLAAAVLFGTTDNIQGLTTVFKSADLAGNAVVGTKNRVTATRQADNDRAAIAVDLT